MQGLGSAGLQPSCRPSQAPAGLQAKCKDLAPPKGLHLPPGGGPGLGRSLMLLLRGIRSGCPAAAASGSSPPGCPSCGSQAALGRWAWARTGWAETVSLPPAVARILGWVCLCGELWVSPGQPGGGL